MGRTAVFSPPGLMLRISFILLVLSLNFRKTVDSTSRASTIAMSSA